MTVSQYVSPINRFSDWVESSPDGVFLRQPSKGQWKEITYRETWEQALKLAKYLTRLPPRSHVAIYSLNCAEWFIVDLAILLAGHISVPIYPTAGRSTIDYILQHGDIKLAFVGKLFDWNDKKASFQSYEVISFFNEKEHFKFWEKEIRAETLLSDIYQPKPDDLATIIYTSGTTGNPKGVMLSYRAISSALTTVEKVFRIDSTDRLFSYLPLAHVAERMIVEMAAFYFGAQVSFVESIDHFAKNLKSVEPTIFFGVPRIWMKIKQGVEAKLGGPKLTKFILNLPVVGNRLKKKIKCGLGFDENRLSLSAAASLPESVIRWFEQFDINICEAYGLSETAGFSHINLPDSRKPGTVGQPFPGAECMLAENGEVLLRNGSLMDGYYKLQELSDMAIQDGWFRTGDLGEIDHNNFLTITGRVKEIFKTSKGKYISPVPIENKLHPQLSVDHLCVTGANLPHPVAIVSYLQSWSKENKKSLEKQVFEVLSKSNQQLEAHERINLILVVDEDWTTENGLMTPTLKIRRQEIDKRYAKLIEQNPSSKKISVVWCDTSDLNTEQL
ncbi:MAG: AMP-binding protein [Gammaproteobacteria bacterium]|nr:AMP-binding protein [Gammaproteobacteria bacterium]